MHEGCKFSSLASPFVSMPPREASSVVTIYEMEISTIANTARLFGHAMNRNALRGQEINEGLIRLYADKKLMRGCYDFTLARS